MRLRQRSNRSVSFTAGVFVLIASGLFSASAQSPLVDINVRSFRDFAARLKSDIKSGSIDLSRQFSIELDFQLDGKGKIDAGSIKVVRAEGDTSMVGVVKEAILTSSESGYFQYLQMLDMKTAKIIVEQAASVFSARLSTDVSERRRARTTAIALNMAVQMVKAKMDRPDLDEIGKRDLILLSGLAVRPVESVVVIDFRLPTEKFVALVTDELNRKIKVGQ